MKELHVQSLSISDAEKLIARVNRPLAEGLAELAPFERRLSKHARPGPTLVRYRYGQLLAGSIETSPDVHMGGFHPPCGNSVKVCDRCKELLESVRNERPLCIVLSHAVEEFLETRAEYSGRGFIRFSPGRVASAGECVNLAETLNSLIDLEFPKGAFKAPVRTASSGIHSAYLTVPFDDKSFKQAVKRAWQQTLNTEPDQAWWNYEWKNIDFLRVASAIGLARMESSWELQTVVIPVSWLRHILYARGVLRNEGKTILLQLLAAGWKQSRGLRATSIRLLTLSEAGHNLPGRTVAEQIVNRLLLILRGDVPGFRPAIGDDVNCPLPAIWQLLLGDPQIQSRFFVDRFPGIIEPFHLNRRTNLPKGTFFYYPLTSFEQLDVADKPVDELDTIEAVDRLLRTIKAKNPGMLGQIKWEFFASPAPMESKLNKVFTNNKKRNVSVPFTSADASEVIQKDFEVQMHIASNFGPVPSRILPKPPRKGFLRRFIRVSVD